MITLYRENDHPRGDAGKWVSKDATRKSAGQIEFGEPEDRLIEPHELEVGMVIDGVGQISRIEPGKVYCGGLPVGVPDHRLVSITTRERVPASNLRPGDRVLKGQHSDAHLVTEVKHQGGKVHVRWQGQPAHRFEEMPADQPVFAKEAREVDHLRIAHEGHNAEYRHAVAELHGFELDDSEGTRVRRGDSEFRSPTTTGRLVHIMSIEDIHRENFVKDNGMQFDSADALAEAAAIAADDQTIRTTGCSRQELDDAQRLRRFVGDDAARDLDPFPVWRD